MSVGGKNRDLGSQRINCDQSARIEAADGGESRNDHTVRIKVTDGKASRKLTVESHDEVFYPKVSFSRKSTTQSPPVTEVKVPTAKVSTDTKENTTTPRVRRSGIKVWFSRFATVATAAIAMIAIALVGARLFGFRTFTVMSGSMEPDYPVGSMIYVQPVDYHNLKVGDVISYVADNDKTIVTHRIASIEIDKKDSDVYRFKTKGDANSSPDSNLVHYKNVLGTPIITIPLIGYVAHNIQQPPGVYIMLVVGTLLLAWTFLPGTLEERRRTARKSVA